MSSLELKYQSTYKVRVEVTETTTEGFTMKVLCNSHGHNIKVSWMASKTSSIRFGHFHEPLQNAVTTPDARKVSNSVSISMVPLSSGDMPVYIAQLSGIDVDSSKKNIRIQVHAELVNLETAMVSAITWCDSVTNSLEAAIIGAMCSASLQATEIRMKKEAGVQAEAAVQLLPPDYELVPLNADRKKPGLLGDGYFGEAYRVRNVLDQQMYCVKIFKAHVDINKITTEIRLLAQ
eukprot:gene56554-77507_t